MSASSERHAAIRPRARALSRAWRSIIAVAATLGVAAVHVPVIGYLKYANVDEGYATALASRLNDGYRLYEGAVSQRGPLMYYLFALYARIGGWDSILSIRIWSLVFALLHLGGAFWAARVLFSERAAYVTLVVTAYALAFGFQPVDAIALNGESLQVPFAIAGIALGGVAMRRPAGTRSRRTLLAAAGVALGCAMCIKQFAALLPVPLLTWLSIEAAGTPPGSARRTRAADALVYIAAVALPTIVAVIHAAADGTLSQLVYYCVTFNLSVHTRPNAVGFDVVRPLFDRVSAGPMFGFLAVLVVALASAWLGRRARAAYRLRDALGLVRGFGARQYVWLAFFCAIVPALKLPQFFGHYFLLALPFASLSFGAAAAPLFRRHAYALEARAVTLGAALLVLAYGGLESAFLLTVDGRVDHDRSLEAAAAYVQRATTPEDHIFVWGFSPWLYGYAHRKPAGRFLFSTYVTGFIPWFHGELAAERQRVVPGSLEALLTDLETEKPELVVDAGNVAMARSMRAYPRAAEWLHAEYCFEARVASFDVYRRKRGGTCETPYFPCPPPPVDYFNRVMFVETAVPVDLAESRFLPPGDVLLPLAFRADPARGVGGDAPTAAGAYPEPRRCVR